MEEILDEYLEEEEKILKQSIHWGKFSLVVLLGIVLVLISCTLGAINLWVAGVAILASYYFLILSFFESVFLREIKYVFLAGGLYVGIPTGVVAMILIMGDGGRFYSPPSYPVGFMIACAVGTVIFVVGGLLGAIITPFVKGMSKKEN
jgi:hypothetical protein